VSGSYQIIELSEAWGEQASAALNRLNHHMLEHGVYGSDRLVPPRCDPEKLIIELEKGRLFGFSAIHRNRLIGIVTYSPIPDPALDNGLYPFVSNIWVDPEHRSHRLGQQMLMRIRKREDTEHLVLVCGEKNPTRDYFAKIGFKEIGLRFMSLG